MIKTAGWMELRWRPLREFLHHWGLVWSWKCCSDELVLATIHVPGEWGYVDGPHTVEGAPREGERTWLINGQEINSRDIAQINDVEGMTGHRCRARRDIRRAYGRTPDPVDWFNSRDEIPKRLAELEKWRKENAETVGESAS